MQMHYGQCDFVMYTDKTKDTYTLSSFPSAAFGGEPHYPSQRNAGGDCQSLNIHIETADAYAQQNQKK